jgi:2-methylcitrate dehydratase PrpD
LAAYVAGWEAETRIARGVNFHHYEKGWHPTATLGVFGSTAACCHLLLAALLAADGFTASVGAFEHKQGFLTVFNGAGNFNAEAILTGWGEPWDIVHPGVAIKQYPCCGSTHPAVDAMLMLVREHGLTPANVQRIDSWTHPRRLAHTNRPDPQSELDAKFSVQYCLARGLVSGRVAIEHFEGDSYRDPAVQAVLKRVHAAPHPEMSMDTFEHFGAEVRVTMADGRVLMQKVSRPLGRGPENPLPVELLEAKFLNCAQRTLPAGAARGLLTLLRGLENVAHLRSITDAMLPLAALAAE